MAYTYYTNINLDGYVYPTQNVILIYQLNNVIFLNSANINNINDFAENITLELTNNISGNPIVSYQITNDIIKFVIITDIEQNNISALQTYDDIDQLFLSPFIPITPELCPTCQEVTIDNCGTIIFEAAIPNGTYEVQIEDHQSGITYMQDIEFTGSQGTWDQTNTAGVFTPFSTYTVTILDESGDPVSWIVGTNEYTCMRLTFNTFTDTTPEG